MPLAVIDTGSARVPGGAAAGVTAVIDGGAPPDGCVCDPAGPPVDDDELALLMSNSGLKAAKTSSGLMIVSWA